MSRHGLAYVRTWPALPLAMLLPCGLMVLAALTDDPGPRPPEGELVPAVVVAAEPARGGKEPYVVLRAATRDGPALCAIARGAFPDERLPPLHRRLTVDYTPDGCRPEPVDNELPRGVVMAMGAGGLALSAFWLWAGRRFERLARRRRRRR